jgi:hypothetical protein
MRIFVSERGEIIGGWRSFINCNPLQILLEWSNQEDAIGLARSTHGGEVHAGF